MKACWGYSNSDQPYNISVKQQMAIARRPGASGHAVTVRAFCEIDSRAQGGMEFGMPFGVLLEVLAMARAHCCEIDGGVLFGALFGGCCWRCRCSIGVLFGIWGLCLLLFAGMLVMLVMLHWCC